MGWNSYNHYSCNPNESIIHSNAQALVDLGLQKRGYHFVTVDCGWTLPNRTTQGTLTWNSARFPSGYPALGDFIHARGLGFGVYSDGGIQMCMTGDPTQAGSQGYEQTDADTFASWGADLLKYDNCYSDAGEGYPDAAYEPDISPKAHYVTMSEAVLSTHRPIIFQICEWGLDFPSAWAPPLGNSWRITNDIIPFYRTIPRILNQAVPQTSYAGPGQWLDLDMLEVGNNVFTTAEEQTHFSLWAIIKSPLIIGAALKDSYTSISAASLAILKNTDVISYNQDALGVAASFKRRWTEAGYEVWSGPLNGGRSVVAFINLQDQARTLTLDLPDAGIQKAGVLKDIWNAETTTNVLTSYTASVQAHGTILLEVGDPTPAGHYDFSDAKTKDQTTTFSKVYGKTSSSNYTANILFASPSISTTTIIVNNNSYTLSASRKSITIPNLTLIAGNANVVTITSPLRPTSLLITPPPESFYPSTSFNLTGDATLVTCDTDLCTPVGSKISYLAPNSSASLTLTSLCVSNSSTTGPKFATIYFCNNDIALSTSWGFGTNTRNMTISVNGVVTRIEVPLSGRSSELFSVGKGWEDTGTFGVLLDGWNEGKNDVVVGNVYGDMGLVRYGADFVGLGVQW